jgi:hypothetical protein
MASLLCRCLATAARPVAVSVTLDASGHVRHFEATVKVKDARPTEGAWNAGRRDLLFSLPTVGMVSWMSDRVRTT